MAGGVGMIGLTPKQAEALAFIKRFLAEHRYSPSFEEIRDGIGYRSHGRVHEILKALEERRHIRRLKCRARAIEVVEKAYPWPAPGIVRHSPTGMLLEASALRFIPLRDVRPLNRKQIAKLERAA